MSKTIRKVSHPPKLAHKTRVAAYARVSSGKDAMLHSLSAQISYYSKLIQNHDGWEYIGVYSDEAFTGTKENRSGFQRMLDDCRAGNIDMVITKSISRFARNTVTLLQTVRELKLLGIDVYFEEQNIHTASADGELMMTILASYAQEESLSASENQKWRVRKAFENGELINLRLMYGYDISKGKIEINSVEANDVRYIFSAFLEGSTLGDIAREMISRNRPCKNGGKWNVQRIKQILQNEKYTGNALLQKKYRNNHLEKKELCNNGCLPKYYAEGTHDAIIDTDTFELAQARLDEVHKNHSAQKPAQHSVFTSFITCPKCGKNYKRITSNGSVGWNCSTYLQQGKTGCHGKKIPEKTLIAVCCEVLSIDNLNEELFKSEVQQIIVPKPNHLTFVMKDGTTVKKVWQNPSRKDSWTDEMKQKASERTILQRRGN